MLKFPIYLDDHATTPVIPEVFKSMEPYFTTFFGNAASRNHEFGWTAEAAVEKARSRVARLIGAKEKEIIFTSGATESDNLALIGSARANRAQGNHIITTAVEHRAVLDVCQSLQREGFEVSFLPVDGYGQVNPEDLRNAIGSKTILFSAILANNEIGTINPARELGRICKERGVIFHTDAVQAPGRIPIDVNALGVDLLSLSAHKIYGPKGVGALFVRKKAPRVKLEPILHGGGHEQGLRPGTLNVPGIVGFGKAAELALRNLDSEPTRLRGLRDRLWRGLQAGLPDIHLNGHATERLPNNLNLIFRGVEGATLMTSVKELAVSSGSACTSADPEPSHVLRAVGVSEEDARSSIRIGIGRFTTEAEIDFTIQKLVETTKVLRKLANSDIDISDIDIKEQS